MEVVYFPVGRVRVSNFFTSTFEWRLVSSEARVWRRAGREARGR